MKKKFLLLMAFAFTFSFTHAQDYFSEGFESGFTSWGNLDEDGDGHVWSVETTQVPHTGLGIAQSSSWIPNVGAVTPDNWLVSPEIDLSNATGNVTLEYWVRADDQDWPGEHYACLISEDGNLVANFTTSLLEETLEKGVDVANALYVKRSVDISSYAGKTINLAWRHFDCTDNFRLSLDDIKVFKNEAVDAGITAMTAPSNEASCTLTDAEAVTITIFNYGGSPISDFDVSYSVNGGTPVTETVSASIEASDSYEYSFSEKADLSALAYYTIDAVVSLTGDADISNDSITKKVAHGDAEITIVAETNAAGDQDWTITNSAGTVIATHGNYQWNITETTKVCVLDDECYTFTWEGTSNNVAISYGGTEVYSAPAVGNFTFFPMGGGCAAIDAALASIHIPAISTPAMIDITGTILNMGLDPITSYDVVYTVGGGAASSTYSVTGANIASAGTADFTHDVPYNFTDGSHNVSVTVSNVNGATDSDTDNNTLTADIFISGNNVQRKVMVMNFTTGQCPNCPPVHTLLDDYHTANPDKVVIIAHHSGFGTDGMTTTEDEELLALFNDGGAVFAPAVAVDRFYWNEVDATGPAYFPVVAGAYSTARIDARYDVPTFVTVAINGSHDAANKQFTVTVSGEFTEDVSPLISDMDLRVSLYIKEDGIVANQAGATSDYVHSDVMRDAISELWGDAGVITTTTNGTTFTKTYTYTYDDSWDASKLELVAFVNNFADDVNNREVLNVVEVKLVDIVSGIADLNIQDFNLYPNPTTDFVQLNMTLKEATSVSIFLTDISGKKVNLVTSKSFSSGEHQLQLQLQSVPVGIYNLNILTKDGQITKKLHIQK